MYIACHLAGRESFNLHVLPSTSQPTRYNYHINNKQLENIYTANKNIFKAGANTSQFSGLASLKTRSGKFSTIFQLKGSRPPCQ